MMLSRKTPMARREARNYCRRCLAMMVFCVFAFCLAVPAAPRAAAIVDGTSAVEIVGGPHLTVIKGGASGGTGTAAASATGSALGAFLLAASGINMMVDSIEYSTTRYYGGEPYEAGNELWAYLYDLGGDIADWCMGVESSSEAAGGIYPGDSFTVPVSVFEASRNWALENLNFSNGSVSYRSNYFSSGDTVILLTPFSSSDWWINNYRISSLGFVFDLPDTPTSFFFETADGPASYTISWDASQHILTCTYVDNSLASHISSIAGSSSGSLKIDGQRISFTCDFLGFGFSAQSFNDSSFLVPCLLGSFTLSGSSPQLVAYSFGSSSFYSSNFFPITTSNDFITTFTETPVLDQPKTEDITITIPKELPTTQVGELTIPVITEITSTDLTEIGGEKDPSTDPQPGTGVTPSQITQAVKDALPVTGSQLGDDVLEETLGEPDTLGGVIITKFPFSIPWDIAKAIELLAAPPKTPRFEFDFFGPMDDLVGGFPGDTTIVIDFAEYEIVGVATRWLSTVFFIYALASGTKRMLWTS